jgi:hypothetical protein
MSTKLVSGLIFFYVAGKLMRAKGEFSYNIGVPKRSTLLGSDGPHGAMEEPQVAFIEGAITDYSDLKLKSLVTTIDGDVSLSLANGKTFSLTSAYYTGEGTVKTKEAEIGVRFESEYEGKES